MDSVKASANMLKDIFYGQDNGNEAAAVFCTPIEVRRKGWMKERSQTI
jgi:hypothetical protein